MKKIAFLFLAASVLIFTNCTEDEGKTGGFNSPDEFLDNSNIQSAINNSGININQGANPPNIEGDYDADGERTKSSSDLTATLGIPFTSNICFYNQSGSTVAFGERVAGISVTGIGSFITGDGDKFTVWGESVQSGTTAGLPVGCTITVAVLISGTKSGDDIVNVDGLSVVTQISNSCGGLPFRKSSWWLWEAELFYIGPNTC